MDFTFLKATGEVAFFRSDAEQAEWTQEEMNLVCSFPFIADKMIERGMTVLFQDPATGDWQAYEIRNCSAYPGEAYQQFTAEDIAVSELTDCHIQNKAELINVSITNALQRVLQNTGWQIGNIGVNPVSSGDISRGSVWTAVCLISNNWNAFIVPRVTVDSTGITGRFLDIVSSEGAFRGLRLAVNKNVSDPCVTYDDTEMYTALYGYGGTYSEGSGDSRVTLEYNFSSVVWEKTASHPAKPAGQRYLEYPEMTALYGRNGKPRYGYYQNTNIQDPNILLEKTWQTLQKVCQPKISISGTVLDLKRIGYADIPLRLHDMAIVELEPVGLQFYKQIIRLTVDLLNPEKNHPEIGDYIPSIIYINHDTEKIATGGGRGSGGGGSGGSTKIDLEYSEFKTTLYDNGRQIGMNAQHIAENQDILAQAGMHIDPDTGVLIYAEDNVNMIGSKFTVTSNAIKSEVKTREANEKNIYSTINQTANEIRLEVSNEVTGLNTKIVQTEGRIMTTVNNEVAGLHTEIVQTDSSIRSMVNNEVAGLNSEITQTADTINQRITNETSGLSSRITQNADKISIVVDDQNNIKTASIVLGINSQTGSYVKISADTINLSGYVTASDLSATNARIDNLVSGSTQANYLNCLAFRCGAGIFTLGSSTVSKGTFTAVTSVDFTNKTVGTTTFNFLKY